MRLFKLPARLGLILEQNEELWGAAKPLTTDPDVKEQKFKERKKKSQKVHVEPKSFLGLVFSLVFSLNILTCGRQI